jgi:hypothetical protein
MRIFQLLSSSRISTHEICAPDVFAVTLNCLTPSSARTYLIAEGNNPIDRCDTVVDVPTTESLLAVKIFYCLPTFKSPVQSRENRVLPRRARRGL